MGSNTSTIPVLMLVFNRPENTKRVLEAILKSKPKRLYVVADGPRPSNPADVEKCHAVRALFSEVLSDTEVIKIFREQNLGSKYSIIEGISKVFETEDKLIILEDDCLPESTFFRFCEEILHRYAENEQVMHINGSNYLRPSDRHPVPYSYYFSTFAHCWGWATWRRAWQKMDIEMKELETDIPGMREWTKGIDHYFINKYIQHFKKVKYQETRIWDYQWTYSVWKNRGLCITPAINQIKNFGFDGDATHTITDYRDFSKMMTTPLVFPIQHPAELKPDLQADNHTLARFYGKNWLERIFQKLLHIRDTLFNS